MDTRFSPEDLAFRDEVGAFFDAAFTPEMYAVAFDLVVAETQNPQCRRPTLNSLGRQYSSFSSA